MDKNRETEPEAAVLQEAVDTIVQEFRYPEEITLQMTSKRQIRETIIEVQDPAGSQTYRLQFDGSQDSNEPLLQPIEDWWCSIIHN